MKKRKITVCFLVCTTALYADIQKQSAVGSESEVIVTHKKKWKIKDCFLANAIKDVVSIHQYIFHWDTLKILSTTFPVYMLTRMFDEDVQSGFYHGHCMRDCHKNVNQAPKWCAELSEYSLSVPIVFMFGSLFVGSEELRTTSWIYLLGMPFVIFGKDVFKKLQFDAAKRPWCEKFDSYERSFGGFPSGHMAEASYVATLYGLRFGVRAAGPLALASTFVGVTFLNCNRHYLSQLVAGAGIGTIFAFAANKVIEKKLANSDTYSVSVEMNINSTGDPMVSVGWHF